jgi:hypothetical protein
MEERTIDSPDMIVRDWIGTSALFASIGTFVDCHAEFSKNMGEAVRAQYIFAVGREISDSKGFTITRYILRPGIALGLDSLSKGP